MPISYIIIFWFSQEIRLGDEDMIRALFNRAISLSLAPKKMKVRIAVYAISPLSGSVCYILIPLLSIISIK